MTKAFIVDEFCDFLDPTKICDNCGACLNLSKSDLQAIKIEEIAKNIEENELVESDLEDSEFFEDEFNIPNLEELIAKAQKIDPNMDKELIEKSLLEAYSNLNENFKEHLETPSYTLANEDEVTILGKDADEEEIIYLEDLNLTEDILESDTEELFPGVRKLKTKNI